MSRPLTATGRPRALLLEDEALIAMDIEQSLIALGFEVVGPFGRSGDALSVLDRTTVDIAVLDYLLGDGTGGIVADRLQRLRVPYVFLTGCQDRVVREGWEDAPVLGKPVSEQRMAEVIGSLCANAMR